MSNRRKYSRALVILLLAGFCLLNGIAWMQAHAMIYYAAGGIATQRPEALSLPERAWTVLSGVNVPRPRNANTPADAGLAYETRTIDAGYGESLEAWFVPGSGSGGIVLMFPGYAASKDSLLSAAQALHEMGYDLLMVDFRGAGGSSGQDTTLGFREAKDVALAVDYAKQAWPGQSVALYGRSMGAAAVMRAVAVEGVEVDELVLESPFNSLLDTASNRFHTMGLPAFPSAQLIMFWGSVQSGYNGFTNNPSEYARSIDTPVLLMYGERDSRVSPEQSQQIYKNLRGPKEAVSFPGAYHQALVDIDGSLWKGSVSRFLRDNIRNP